MKAGQHYNTAADFAAGVLAGLALALLLESLAGGAILAAVARLLS